MKIALAQFPVEPSHPKVNLKRIERYAANASTASASALFIPEMCTTGFEWKYNCEYLSETDDDLKQIAEIAHVNSISICGVILGGEQSQAILRIHSFISIPKERFRPATEKYICFLFFMKTDILKVVGKFSSLIQT